MKKSLAIVAATVALVASCGGSSSPKPATPTASTPTATAAASIPGVISVSGLPHTHFLGVHLTYSHTPPLGGDHSPYPLTCAVYTSAVPNENAVHSLEHGAVWLTYLPGVDPAPLAKLAEIDPAYVLVSPYPGQPSKVVATAWGLQLRVDSPNDPRLKTFVERYQSGGQGGEKGAACNAVTPDQARALLAQGPPQGQPSPPVPADQTSAG